MLNVIRQGGVNTVGPLRTKKEVFQNESSAVFIHFEKVQRIAGWYPVVLVLCIPQKEKQ